MAALKEQTAGRVRFAGVGGPLMEAEGLRSLFAYEQLAVMGLLEVLPHLPRIFRCIYQTVAAARRLRPDVLVTIDSPSFSLEVSQRLRGRGFPLVHYVAPSVWAWKAWRARRMAGYLDHLLAMLPFEPPYFERHGLATTVVGHPAVESDGVAADAKAFRQRHGVPEDACVLSVLPGSRRSEVRRLGPVFGRALELLGREQPSLHAVLPTVSTVAREVRAVSRSWHVPTHIVESPAERRDAFAASRAALAASGTVAVELAVAGVPAVIAYRVHPLSAMIARRLLTIRYVSIPNLVLDRPLQPELLQERCEPDRLARAVAQLLPDCPARLAQLAGCREATALLSGPDGAPSHTAARKILSLLDDAKGLERRAAQG